MTAHVDEDRAIEEIIARLQEKFPDHAPQAVTQVVQGVYSEMEQARVRDFVPVLVEKTSAKRLKAAR